MSNAKQGCHNLKSLVKVVSCCPAQSSWCSKGSKGTLKKLRYEISEYVMDHIHATIKDSVMNL